MALWHFIRQDGDVITPVSWDEGDQHVSAFDDGLDRNPDEDGFSRSAADQKASSIGDGVVAVYTGTPGYAARIAAEGIAAQAAKDAADAAIAAQDEADRAAAEQASRDQAIAAQAAADKLQADAIITDLLMTPEERDQARVDAARADVNARFDVLLAAAPDRSEDIATLRAQALAQFE